MRWDDWADDGGGVLREGERPSEARVRTMNGRAEGEGVRSDGLEDRGMAGSK